MGLPLITLQPGGSRPPTPTQKSNILAILGAAPAAHGHAITDIAGLSEALAYLVDAPPVNVSSVAGVLTLDMALSSTFFTTLTEETQLVVTNRLPGACVLYVTQGAGFGITLEVTCLTPSGHPLSLSPVAGSVDVLTLVCDGNTVFVSASPNWQASLTYEAETLAYMDSSGAVAAVKDPLDAWIKGLKALGAWAGSKMWILRGDYHAPGFTVHGIGEVPLHGLKESGLGLITVGADEFYFSRGTARIWTPQVLMPASPLMSLMIVGKTAYIYANYGSMFGGRNGFAGFATAAFGAVGVETGTTDDKSVGFPNATLGVSPNLAARKSMFMTITGERAGSCSINGGALVAASSAGSDKNYSDLAKDTQTNIFGPGDYAAQSASPAAASFVGFWPTNQSAKAAAIHSLYKATIGAGLGLP